ncbi:Transcription termination factor 3 [Nymphaea thermarum]|nr:Transcription termination factor 3 [Nymphaea thermarum]
MTSNILARIVVRRPEILTALEFDSLIDFISENLECFRGTKIEKLFLAADAQLVEKFETLLDRRPLGVELAGILSKVDLRKLFCEKTVEEIEATIAFLKRYHVGDHLLLIKKRPALLTFDLKNQLVPRVDFLQRLACDDESLSVLLSRFPAVLSYTVEHLEGHCAFWRNLGFRDEQVFRLIEVYPSIFSVSKERKLEPRVGFLKSCGFSSNDIYKFVIKSPLFLGLSCRRNLSKKLAFLIKIGYKNKTKELALALGASTRTSCENMQKVVGVFLRYGFSFEDLFFMSIIHPQILQYNHNSLEKKMDYLINDMGREIGELLSFPAYLGYKLDDRIKHRHEARKQLKARGLLKRDQYSLKKLLSVSSKRFLKSAREKKMLEREAEDLVGEGKLVER